MNDKTFKRRLDSTLKDNALERYISGRKKGKLDFKKLHKISHSKGIFKQKEERKGKDYSITLILDSSGSMRGDRAEILMNSVQHLAPVFESSDIPTSVFAFNQLPFILKDFDQKLELKKVIKEYRNTFNEDYGICQYCGNWELLTDQDVRNYRNGLNMETRCSVCNKLYSGYSSCEDGTFDSLALHIIGNRVCKRNKKNIVIVITDGEGSVSNGSYSGVDFDKLINTRTVLKGLHKKYNDLIVLCVGIRTNSAPRIYGNQNTVVISDAKDVFGAVIKLLFKNIKRA